MKTVWTAPLLIAALAYTVFGWTAGNLTVAVTSSPMDIDIAAGSTTLIDITGITFGTTSYAGISSITTATDSLILAFSGSQTLVIRNLSTGGIRIYGTSASATSVGITMKDQGDHFFGITEQNASTTNNNPDLRGRIISITATNISTGMNNAEPNAKVWSSIYMSSLGYAGFFDSFAEGTYAFGVGNQTTITHSTNMIDWYVFYGPLGDKICQQYFKIIGTPKKVPIWACGLVIWNDNFASASGTLPAVMDYAARFNANQLPCSALWIDRPYSDGAQEWGYMNFNAAFSSPAPAVWVKQLSSDTGYNIKLMTWVAPCTFGTPVPPAGLYFPGGSGSNLFDYLDLSNPTAFNWYVHQLDSLQNSVGVQGHKMDRCEEQMTYVLSGTWADGTPTAQKQGKYLFLNAKVTDSSLRIRWGDDQFNFPRGAYQRCQHYCGAVWAGDTRASWPGLVGAIGNGVKVGFMGFPMWGPDIGGYFTGATKIPTNLFMRWLGFGCFCGLMENMLDGKEPWLYTAIDDSAGLGGQTFMKRYAAFGSLRQSMIPYTYSLANTSSNNGVMMKPLPYLYPTDANVDTIGDEYLLGPAFLCAPISSANNTRSVYLPNDIWYYFFNYAETHTGGRFTTANIPLYEVPVYIKANSIYPTGRIYPGNTAKWIANFNSTRYVQVNAFPGTTKGLTSTFNYLDYLDGNALKALTVTTGPASDTMVTVNAPAMTVPETLMVRLNSQPVSVVLNNASLSTSQYQFNAATKKLTVGVPSATAATLVINGGAVGVRQVPEVALLTGKLELRGGPNGMMLVVPGVSGVNPKSRMDIALFNLTGKAVWNGSLAVPTRASFMVLPARIVHGIYFGSVKVNGIMVERSRVVLP